MTTHPTAGYRLIEAPGAAAEVVQRMASAPKLIRTRLRQERYERRRRGVGIFAQSRPEGFPMPSVAVDLESGVVSYYGPSVLVHEEVNPERAARVVAWAIATFPRATDTTEFCDLTGPAALTFADAIGGLIT
jgi:hypothetical protein